MAWLPSGSSQLRITIHSSLGRPSFASVSIALSLNSLSPSFSISRSLEAHLLTRNMSCLKFNSLIARWSSTRNGNSDLIPSYAIAFMKVFSLPKNAILSAVLSSVSDRVLSFITNVGIDDSVDTMLLLLASWDSSWGSLLYCDLWKADLVKFWGMGSSMKSRWLWYKISRLSSLAGLKRLGWLAFSSDLDGFLLLFDPLVFGCLALVEKFGPRAMFLPLSFLHEFTRWFPPSRAENGFDSACLTISSFSMSSPVGWVTGRR